MSMTNCKVAMTVQRADHLCVGGTVLTIEGVWWDSVGRVDQRWTPECWDIVGIVGYRGIQGQCWPLLTSEGHQPECWDVVGYRGTVLTSPIRPTMGQCWPVRVCVGRDEDERQPTCGHCWFSTKFFGCANRPLHICWLFFSISLPPFQLLSFFASLPWGVLIDLLIKWPINPQEERGANTLSTRRHIPSQTKLTYNGSSDFGEIIFSFAQISSVAQKFQILAKYQVSTKNLTNITAGRISLFIIGWVVVQTEFSTLISSTFNLFV